MDNCSIHGAADTLRALFDLVEVAGIRLIYLPPYSPELNPCELVFASVKNYLRANRGKDNFDKEILFALSQQTHASVASMYFDCIWLDFLNPPEFWILSVNLFLNFVRKCIIIQNTGNLKENDSIIQISSLNKKQKGQRKASLQVKSWRG